MIEPTKPGSSPFFGQVNYRNSIPSLPYSFPTTSHAHLFERLLHGPKNTEVTKRERLHTNGDKFWIIDKNNKKLLA